LLGGEMTVSSTPGRGTLFRIRLFLPAAHGTPPAAQVARAPRVGYRGPRRRILAVDNEEADRALLAQLLQPLGFEVALAASGQDGLDALPTARPDAVLMDLAMPGLDGWATVRALRARPDGSALPVAIVSGNAYDRQLDNDVGLQPGDFVLKPVRRDELLDWLGARLDLDWIEAEPQAPVPPPGPRVAPSADELDALQSLVDLGYLRGLHARLDTLEQADPAQAGFVQRLRALARGCELDTLSTVLKEARHHA